MAACCPERGDAPTGRVGSPGVLPWIAFPSASSGVRRVKEYFLGVQKMGLFLLLEPPGFQRWMSGWCRGSTRSKRQASKNIYIFLAADEGVTQSFDFFLDGILIGCRVLENRCRIVDANVRGILPREVAQAGMVPTNSFHGI